MKRIWLSVFLSLAVLAIPVLSLAAPKPVFDNTSTASYEGAAKTGNIMVTAMINGTLQKVHFIAKNKGADHNVAINFTNISSVPETEGSVLFPNDGVWIEFDDGPFLQRNINLFEGVAPAWGAIKISGDATFNPADRTVSGTNGSIVQWDGNIDFRGVLKSGGERGTVKIKVNPTNAHLITFINSSSTSTHAVPRISLPAIQMDRI